MSLGRARVAASILDADLANLAQAVRRATRAGADRIHLDVMDGHFVPNLTFGARTIKALRPVTDIPFDAHLMISEPGRYIEEYLDAGCDSVTFHVEIDEAIEPTLRTIQAAGRAAGLAVRPRTPLTALDPYREMLDIVLVMTVEPGFGGQSFMADVAREKLLAAREYLGHRPVGGEVHVDGGVNRETAEIVGGQGADILVVGSALFAPGRDMAREIRLIRSLADEGYQYQLNEGQPPIERDRWVRVATVPKAIAERLRGTIEAGGIPVIMLRGDGQLNPDGVRDYDLLVPAAAESIARERHAAQIAAGEGEAEAWRASLRAERPPGDGGGVA